MLEQVNVGFIGCGGNARGHMRRVAALRNTRIVGVCDVVPELSARAAADTSATAYDDHRRLLERDDLNAVYISIPVYAHGAPELDTLDRGLPFLVEKPVALDMATAREVEARVAAAGVLTAVGYQLRYSPTVDAAREALGASVLGLVRGRYWCNSGLGDPSRWLRQMDLSGGQLVEQATHTLDMMRCLAGEVEEVYCASASRVLREIDCPDFSAATLRFANGAVGSFTASWAFGQGWSHTNVVDILHDDALLTWTYGKLTIQRGGQTEEVVRTGPGIDEVFIAAVRSGDGRHIRSPYHDAVRSLAVSLALNRSARENRVVRVSEVG